MEDEDLGAVEDPGSHVVASGWSGGGVGAGATGLGHDLHNCGPVPIVGAVAWEGRDLVGFELGGHRHDVGWGGRFLIGWEKMGWHKKSAERKWVKLGEGGTESRDGCAGGVM